jgi:AcrR family transcriptional regulator
MQDVETHAPERKDARANRERILLAAREECAARGLALEMKDVAERAGVGVGTLYRHFASRENLLAAVIGEARHDIRHEMFTTLREGEPEEAFRSVLRIACLAHERYGALTELAIAGSADHADHKEEFLAEFQDLIRRGIVSGAFRADLDPEVLTMTLESVFMSGKLVELAAERGYAEAADALARLILHGCKPARTAQATV